VPTEPPDPVNSSGGLENRCHAAEMYHNAPRAAASRIVPPDSPNIQPVGQHGGHLRGTQRQGELGRQRASHRTDETVQERLRKTKGDHRTTSSRPAASRKSSIGRYSRKSPFGPFLSGEGGIRTPDEPEPILVFETSAFNHSATSPDANCSAETAVSAPLPHAPANIF
jgi:hypothetical protein